MDQNPMFSDFNSYVKNYIRSTIPSLLSRQVVKLSFPSQFLNKYTHETESQNFADPMFSKSFLLVKSRVQKCRPR